MTIRTAVLCDSCDAVFVADTGTPRGLLTIQAHDAGWTSIGRNGTWRNYCDECSAGARNEPAVATPDHDTATARINRGHRNELETTND